MTQSIFITRVCVSVCLRERVHSYLLLFFMCQLKDSLLRLLHNAASHSFNAWTDGTDDLTLQENVHLCTCLGMIKWQGISKAVTYHHDENRPGRSGQGSHIKATLIFWIHIPEFINFNKLSSYHKVCDSSLKNWILCSKHWFHLNLWREVQQLCSWENKDEKKKHVQPMKLKASIHIKKPTTFWLHGISLQLKIITGGVMS